MCNIFDVSHTWLCHQNSVVCFKDIDFLARIVATVKCTFSELFLSLGQSHRLCVLVLTIFNKGSYLTFKSIFHNAPTSANH